MGVGQIELSDYSFDDLDALRLRVIERMEYVRTEKMREAVARLEGIARELGMDRGDVVAHLTGKPAKKRRRRATLKYRNPRDPTRTWSGRGKKPDWVLQHLSAGGRIEDLRITAPTPEDQR